MAEVQYSCLFIKIINRHGFMHHVHIYFNDAVKDTAMALREKISKDFPNLKQGRVHDAPIGPHPMGSFLVIVENNLAVFKKYLSQEHNGLSILIHPETGDDYNDHAEANIEWLGTARHLNRDVFGPKV
ncbi:MAG: 4,5-dioxygenase [Alphaproteobacteria bacterium]|nr:4,5-dioxygenase [Alphaproteobacteria bacterium]